MPLFLLYFLASETVSDGASAALLRHCRLGPAIHVFGAVQT
jgi:hypothetical protein